jgi:hypothetical protein
MYADKSVGVDDYVYVGSNSNYGLGVAISQGGGTFGTYLYFTFAPSCNRAGVRFAKITGNGKTGYDGHICPMLTNLQCVMTFAV